MPLPVNFCFNLKQFTIYCDNLQHSDCNPEIRASIGDMIRANAQPRKGRRQGDAAVEISGTPANDASAPHPTDTAPACFRLAREENAELDAEVGRLEEEVAGLKAELAESRRNEVSLI